jgi:transcriptional regulator with XRE-family HTH domain
MAGPSVDGSHAVPGVGSGNAVTEERNVSSFERQRAAFGARLRQLREEAGLTGKDLADRLGWLPPKVSKIERGNQTVSDSDVTAWCEALGASGSLAADLLDQARSVRLEYKTWRQHLRAGTRARQEYSVELEAAAQTIRSVDFSVVPGLLQTPEYARHVFEVVSDLLETPRDIEESVLTRMRRQRILYETGRTLEMLVSEAVLRHPVCPPAAMVAQIDRLVSMLSMPNVRLGVVPFDRPLPFIPMHSYMHIDDRVMVETVSAELSITDPDQVAIYERLTDRVWGVAVENEEARRLLVRAGELWAAQAAD